LSHTRVCVGQLPHAAEELSRSLTYLREESPRSIHFAELNRRYLQFARLAAKDAMADSPEMLVCLGITLPQAEFLRNLSDDDLDRLAFGWGNPIVRFTRRAFQRGVELDTLAGQQHATAFVTARPSPDEIPRR